jgi:hypothetical protein
LEQIRAIHIADVDLITSRAIRDENDSRAIWREFCRPVTSFGGGYLAAAIVLIGTSQIQAPQTRAGFHKFSGIFTFPQRLPWPKPSKLLLGSG